ncbi:dTDP-6-deoxy-L-hexose 3-O-methyltransferase, partial [Escherichia coli]|nr:dTDP-6-deoxy-L-hexose 3-O-methyltransferase [Escherichia coli]EFG0735561.1 dTDP-6-deoxy-L-hexose 3-O-methyltransferase [Escherichia coli]EFI3337710.1 dTDP-6-deoxy-L-hexose 3-O-methyltransferase [Escherichia coli]
MTTISRERIEQYVNDPRMCNVNDEIRQIARIALASLEAEPVAWECGENIILFNPDTVEAYAKRAEISPKPLFSAPPALVVPEFETWFNSQESGRSICSTQIRRSLQEISWNACRAAMLHAGNFREIPETSTNSPVTPTLLPGGFTVEDAKELHEDLVRSHISQALSGEKMKKKDRDADLRWIHGV